MDISDVALPAVLIDRLVDIPFGHFRERSLAELQCVVITRDNVKKSLVEKGLIDQSGRAA